MATQLITPELIATAVSDNGKPLEIRCPSHLGLAYAMGPNTAPGNGTFQYRCRIDGKQRCIKICKASEKSLSEVFAIYETLKADVASGIDPTADKAKPADQMTYQEFMTDHYMPFAKTKKRSWRMDENLCRLRLFPEFGDIKLSEISTKHIQRFHVSLKESGLAGATCDHYLQLLKRSLRLACDWELLDKSPADKVKLFREPNAKERYMTDEELSRLMSVLLSEKYRQNNVALLARLCLATGVRKNEGLRAKWEHINLEEKVFLIPRESSKNKKTGSIPLNPVALEVLAELPTRGNHEYLFVNPVTGERLKWANKTWGRIRAEAGLNDISIHQLRHEFCARLVQGNVPLFSAMQLMRHSNFSMTQRYAHLSRRELESASEVASDSIRAAMERAS